MPKTLFLASGVLLLVAGATVAWRVNHNAAPEMVFDFGQRPSEAGPLCPWREPEQDLQRLFPGATGYELETRILSGARTELARRLGREPTGDENALHLHRIYRDSACLGTVLTRRVKGEFGAMELVLAVNMDGQLNAVRLQRLREPQIISNALQSPEWLASFKGKTADSEWKLGNDVPDVPADARPSALAILDGARTSLILFATAQELAAASPAHH